MKTILLIVALIGVACGRSLGNGEQLLDAERLSFAEHTAEFIKSLQEYSENGRSDFTRVQVNANAYFDEFFKLLGQFLIDGGFDPMSLPDLVKSFKWTIFSGELSFKKGWLNDLNTIHRVGDAIIKYNNKLFNIRVPIKFDSLLFNYDYRAKFMGIGPSGGVDGRLENVEIYIDFIIDVYELEIILQDFDIQKAGSIKLKWTGNVLVDWIANIFTSVTVRFLHGIIVNLLDSYIGNFIEDLLEQINKDLGSILG